MKQLLQNLADGSSTITEAPIPTLNKNSILISTRCSLISTGTERMLVDFGKASWLSKARLQPEKVKMVLEKVKTDGFLTTLDAVRSKLDQPIPLGYCNVGTVLETGKDVQGFKVGDRIISNGAHADIVRVAKYLCAKIPHNVDDESAAFTVLASIGLQGIRLAEPTLGESVAVIGAGLIGLLTIQLLKAQGCRVLAIDFDDKKLALAQIFGADICHLSQNEDPITAGEHFSRGQGVDAVIITASTQSSDPVKQAAVMSRKRGRIVLVGVTGLELNRADFYEKELTFQVSCSYGPGRYDKSYEEQGQDYPIGFVRWTEQRNFEAVLDLMACGLLNVKPLITHSIAFENADEAYQVLTEDKSALGILLNYASEQSTRLIKDVNLTPPCQFKPNKPILGLIGAGNYASRILIPALKSLKAQCKSIVTSSGINGVIHGKKAGFITASTDVDTIFKDEEINTVILVTQHHTHASLVIKALKAGKHVFVEKPLAMNLNELSEIEATYHAQHITGQSKQVMVGFNRRFSPHIKKMKMLLQTVKEPKSFIMTINAGKIPPDHWTQNLDTGGGRILGEACHFIDLMRFLTGHAIISVTARCMGDSPGLLITEDKATITLGFTDGSFGTIHYFANGAPSFPKERIEVFTANRILKLDNFRSLQGFGWPGFHKMNLWRQDKGQTHCIASFLQCIENGANAPIPFQELIEVSRVTIKASEILRNQSE